MLRLVSIRRSLALLSTGTCLLVGAAGAGAAHAATGGGIQAHNNPAADCDRSAPRVSIDLSTFDACRANEGVGPLTLPANWNSLTPSQQQFVIIDLERVNRGLAPIVGLSASLSALAVGGADSDDDPAFPTGGFVGGGGIWAAAPSALQADYEWMYDDGNNGFDANVDCPSGGGSGCWLHRDIILWRGDGGPLVAGAAYLRQSRYGSYAFEVLSGYSTAGLTFTWAHEVHYFATAPGVEALGSAARKAAAKRKAAAARRAAAKHKVAVKRKPAAKRKPAVKRNPAAKRKPAAQAPKHHKRPVASGGPTITITIR
jgi:hypothetical protein